MINFEDSYKSPLSAKLSYRRKKIFQFGFKKKLKNESCMPEGKFDGSLFTGVRFII